MKEKAAEGHKGARKEWNNRMYWNGKSFHANSSTNITFIYLYVKMICIVPYLILTV